MKAGNLTENPEVDVLRDIRPLRQRHYGRSKKETSEIRALPQVENTRP
jgi:hypothetical protein